MISCKNISIKYVLKVEVVLVMMHGLIGILKSLVLILMVLCGLMIIVLGVDLAILPAENQRV